MLKYKMSHYIILTDIVVDALPSTDDTKMLSNKYYLCEQQCAQTLSVL